MEPLHQLLRQQVGVDDDDDDEDANNANQLRDLPPNLLRLNGRTSDGGAGGGGGGGTSVQDREDDDDDDTETKRVHLPGTSARQIRRGTGRFPLI